MVSRSDNFISQTWQKLASRLSKAPVEESQTSHVASLARQFAEHPSLALTPSKLAGIFSDAEQGNLVQQCNLFEDMEEKDGHIFTEMSKRKRAILGLDWSLQPPRNATAGEKKTAEMLQEWIKDMDDFEDVLLDMGDAIGKGYSNHEIAWAREGKLLMPSLTHRPANWFTVDKLDSDKLLLRNDTGHGEELWPFGWLSHVHKSKTGYISRAGLFRVLAWPYLFKNYSVRDLAEFLEIYGLPVRIGTYPTGASDKEKMALMRAVMSIGHNAAGVIPQGMLIDFKEAAKGSSDPYKLMMDWCEATVSKAVLGGTLTTTAEATGMGSNLGDVHNDVRHDLLISDVRQFAGTLRRDLILPMAVLNIPGVDPNRLPYFKWNTQEPEDLKLYADAIPKLVENGMKISVEWAHEKLQIPIAEDGDDILKTTTPAPLQQPGNAATAALMAGDNKDGVDQFVERLQKEGDAAIEKIIDKVKKLVDDVDTMEQLEQRLLEIYSFLDPEEFTKVMQLSLSAAELAGRFDVTEGK